MFGLLRRANREVVEQLALPLERFPPIYFASGTNHPGEIRGFAKEGQPLGTVASKECNPQCRLELERLAGTGLPVFIDSAAFSEVSADPKIQRAAGLKPQPGALLVVKPISDADWRERLDFYKHIGSVLGPQLYAVAPDRVGDQQVTLERLARYADDVHHLRDMGVHVMVPLQRGPMALPEFDRRVQEVLGRDDYIVAFPMKKGATEPEKIEAFLDYRCPAAIHLLGLGEKNKNAPDIIELIQERCPSTQISLDSVKIRAQVGWEYKDYTDRMEDLGLEPMSKKEWTPSHHLILPGFRREKGKPREFTLAREFVGPLRPRFSVEAAAVHQKDLGLEEWGIEVLDDRAMVDRVDEWLPRPKRKEVQRQRELVDLWQIYDRGPTGTGSLSAEDRRILKGTPKKGAKKLDREERWKRWQILRRTGDVDRPPELSWYPHARAWPSDADQYPRRKGDVDLVKVFLKSPHTYMTAEDDVGREMSAVGLPRARGQMPFSVLPRPVGSEPSPPLASERRTEAWYAFWANALRPLYLNYLSSRKLDGGDVETAWRKQKATRAAFGSGDLARQYRAWKSDLGKVTDQREYDIELALTYETRPFIVPSDEDWAVIVRGMSYPEYEEHRLERVDEIPLEQLWAWETSRPGARPSTWSQDVLRLPVPERRQLLEELLEHRVAVQLGRKPPKLSHPVPASVLHAGVAANPSRQRDHAARYVRWLARSRVPVLTGRAPAPVTP